MKTVQYSREINAPAEKVYITMLGLDDKSTYEKWTSAFNPVSTYEGSWDKGSKIIFSGEDELGNTGGMIAEIVENDPTRYVSIRHYGIIDGEQEITEGPQVEKWAGALENYTFTEKEGVTTLQIDIDIAEDYIDHFNDLWPKALDKLKDLAEE